MWRGVKKLRRGSREREKTYFGFRNRCAKRPKSSIGRTQLPSVVRNKNPWLRRRSINCVSPPPTSWSVLRIRSLFPLPPVRTTSIQVSIPCRFSMVRYHFWTPPAADHTISLKNDPRTHSTTHPPLSRKRTSPKHVRTCPCVYYNWSQAIPYSLSCFVPSRISFGTGTRLNHRNRNLNWNRNFQ